MTRWIALALVGLSLNAVGAPPAVYLKTVNMELDAAYQRVYQALEEQRFWIVFEADMGERRASNKGAGEERHPAATIARTTPAH